MNHSTDRRLVSLSKKDRISLKDYMLLRLSNYAGEDIALKIEDVWEDVFEPVWGEFLRTVKDDSSLRKILNSKTQDIPLSTLIMKPKTGRPPDENLEIRVKLLCGVSISQLKDVYSERKISEAMRSAGNSQYERDRATKKGKKQGVVAVDRAWRRVSLRDLSRCIFDFSVTKLDEMSDPIFLDTEESIENSVSPKIEKKLERVFAKATKRVN